MTFLPSALSVELHNSHRGISTGRVHAVRGSIILVKLPAARMGEVVHIRVGTGELLPALVVGFEADLISLLPLAHPDSIAPGLLVETSGASAQLKIPHACVGSIIDALGNPLPTASERETVTGGTPPGAYGEVPFVSCPPPPLDRLPLTTPFITGVQSIDALLPLAHGQRIGIFAPAGVGKSMLLGAIARNADCDVVVVGLIGERGREVIDFLNTTLGAEGRRKSVVVCATSDEPPAKRMLAAQSATAIAEHFRRQGKRVLLLMDSLTRVARAIREVTLCLGELPVRHGYTPSVFTELPRLLERAGTDRAGSITAIYTLLSSEESEHDPLTEEVISLLDGHIQMSHKMVLRGVRPAIDPTRSLSRLTTALRSADEQQDMQLIVQSLAKLWREKEMLLFGAQPDASLAHLLSLEKDLVSFLSHTASAKGDTSERTRPRDAGESPMKACSLLASRIRSGPSSQNMPLPSNANSRAALHL